MTHGCRSFTFFTCAGCSVLFPCSGAAPGSPSLKTCCDATADGTTNLLATVQGLGTIGLATGMLVVSHP